MFDKSSNFEAVDAHVENFNLAQISVAQLETASVKDKIKSICEIYKGLKPILSFIIKILPGRWKKIVEKFFSVMDMVCPD